MTDEPAWWCEAYGPPEAGVTAGAWPRCFLSAESGQRVCATAVACREAIAGERARVFTLIQEHAADGDPVSRFLAEQFGTPQELLDGESRP